MNERQTHWDNVYQDKFKTAYTWTQLKPTLSLRWIESLGLDKSAPIIDIGGGDSRLAEQLLELGYSDITVLDISENAIQRVKTRMGEKAKAIHWIVSDILAFKPERTYMLWHDRAAFHFLRNQVDIQKYLEVCVNASVAQAKIIIGTFSLVGPQQCSGLKVKQYDISSMTALFEPSFDRMESTYSDHITPSNAIQNFTFCLFQKRLDHQDINHTEMGNHDMSSQVKLVSESENVCHLEKGACCC
jgi:SAM-dependent methyltransferase